MRVLLIVVLITLLSVGGAAAQTDAATCSALVDQALSALETRCGGMDRNSACYGYTRLQATPFDPLTPITFSAPDDRAALAALSQVQTAPLDPISGDWGIAVLKVQANIPEALPGQAVTFLLMGDVQLENAVDPSSGQPPMQAIYFRTGITGTECSDAPEPALVIQSPENLTVNLTVNGADISIGSTAVLTTLPGEADPEAVDLEITVIDGRVTLPDGRIIPSGFWSRAELDADGRFVPGAGFREINTMTGVAIDAALPFERVPLGVLAYRISTPTLEQVDLLGALDLAFVQGFAPDLVRPLADALIGVGASPDDVRGFGQQQLGRFLITRLNRQLPDLPANLDAETIQRLREAFIIAGY